MSTNMQRQQFLSACKKPQPYMARRCHYARLTGGEMRVTICQSVMIYALNSLHRWLFHSDWLKAKRSPLENCEATTATAIRTQLILSCPVTLCLKITL